MGKYKNMFQEPMTSREARALYFQAVTKENREELFEDYREYVNPIIQKELDESDNILC